MLTVQYAKTHPEIRFNAVDPGFTAIDLVPISSQVQSVDQGAAVIVRMAGTGPDGPTATSTGNDGPLGW